MGKKRAGSGTESRLQEHMEALALALEHAGRRKPLRAYVQRLLLPVERNSVEPMAAKIDPGCTRARHQSMHHLVAKAAWDLRSMLGVGRVACIGPRGLPADRAS